ncbi:hypothetical protein [Peribacillus sp. SCS-155]
MIKINIGVISSPFIIVISGVSFLSNNFNSKKSSGFEVIVAALLVA